MNLLVTGPPGCGKTTAMRRLCELLSASGLRVAGVLSDEVRKGGRRVGFKLSPIGGDAKTMAHESFVSLQRVGRYGVDVEIVNYVADTCLRRVDADVVIIDEIGKMECFSKRFVAAVEGLLSGPMPVVATVSLGGQGFIAEVKERDDCELLDLTVDNRDQLPAQLAERINGR